MFAQADELLRGDGRHALDAERAPWRALAALLVCTGAAYGAAMGTWSGRGLQVAYSALKVPLLLTFTSAVCVPSFYVVNSVLGLRDDFSAACRGLLAAQATLAVALAALAPLTGFVYLSGCSYPGATLTNGAAFALATLAGQCTLARHYGPLIEKDARHRIGLALWLALYVFVAIQLAWSLRPFIGWPGTETTFFRAGSWSNAYVDAVEAWRAAVGS